jgi:drug/metabolite transporter (DMT)-like permease
MFKGKKLKGVLLGFAATVFWASFYTVGRCVFGENEDFIDPLFFTFLRFIPASVFFIAVMAWRGVLGSAAMALGKNLWIYFFLALTGIVGEGALVFWSLKYTTAARSSLFANMSPIFTVLLAIFALGEKCGPRKTLGVIIGFAGAAAAIFGRGQSDMYISAAGVFGDLLALASGVCWAAYTVWGTGVATRHGGLVSSGLTIIAGTVLLGVLVLVTGRPMVWVFSWKLWLAVIYLGVFGNAVAYLCWYAALKYLRAGELGAFGYVSAALSALLSFLFLKESFSVWFFIALGAVILGVYLIIESDPAETKRAEAGPAP